MPVLRRTTERVSEAYAEGFQKAWCLFGMAAI
jgi:hypothetical protein